MRKIFIALLLLCLALAPAFAGERMSTGGAVAHASDPIGR